MKKFNVLRQLIKEELNSLLVEEFSVTTGNFVKELEKFLKLQIKKGNIKNMSEDDVETHADIMYRALIANKNMKKGFKL